MKILPVNNTFNINKNNHYKPSFQAKMPEEYDRIDFRVDEAGMHIVRSRTPYPWNEPWDDQINDIVDKRPLPKNPQEIKRKAFLTQEQYDEKIRQRYGILYLHSRKPVMEALYDMNIEELEEKLNNLDGLKFYEVTKQPFFMLGLADIPLNNRNKDFIERILSKIETAHNTINVMDENGITLLEKVMNAENETYLATIEKVCSRRGDSNHSLGIAYDPMQKFAFDNIQNPEFKKKCKNLPMKFFDIIDDIERKDLKSLDNDIQEQMKCGFCDLEYAIVTSIYIPAIKKGLDYTKIVFDIAQKHFPKEIAPLYKQLLYMGRL